MPLGDSLSPLDLWLCVPEHLVVAERTHGRDVRGEVEVPSSEVSGIERSLEPLLAFSKSLFDVLAISHVTSGLRGADAFVNGTEARGSVPSAQAHSLSRNELHLARALSSSGVGSAP